MSDAVVDRIIPHIEENIGSSSVSYEEIGSVLSQADEALNLVRSSSYGKNLTNIAYIYNSTEAGAFGVFDPSIDKSVKVKIVEDKMSSMGYETDYTDGKLYAWVPGKDPEEIRSQMDSLYNELDLKGGLVIGINAERIMSVARQNFEELQRQSDGSEQYAPLDNDDLDQLIAIHLGSTIVHETVHALGDKGESGPIAAQNAWINEIMPKINAQRAAQGRVPLEMSGETYTALGRPGKVVFAQTAGFNEYVLPEVMLNKDRGISPLLVDREMHDSIETILAKNHHDPIDPEFTTEKELGKDRMDTESEMMIIEDLLDENRPHPIIKMVRKQAGINSNIGGPFISSPFSIDEMVPRVLDGSDIQDRIDYKEGEDPYWHYRYKPENVTWKRDRFGRLTYNYDERLRVVDYDNNNPATWDMLFREDIVTGPWRRMGSNNEGRINTNSAIRTIGYYKNLVKSGRRRAVRFITDSDVSQMVLDMLADVGVLSFDHGDEISLWIWGDNASKEDIVWLEESITRGSDLDKVNEFIGTADDIRERINTIVSKAAEICREHGIDDVYIVGGFPRTMAGTKDYLEVNDLDFTSGNPDQCLKLGGLLAAEFGVEASIYHRTMTMSFEILGIKMDFRGNFVSQDVRDLMRSAGIPTTPLNYDIYARDFTVNSLIYDFVENKVYDVTGKGLSDLKKKLIRTHFEPEKVIPGNVLIITRAMIMNMRGYSIDDNLYHAMKKMSHLVFSSDISEIRLAYEYDKLMTYDDAPFMLKEFGLGRLKDISEKAKRENPELFE